MIQTVALLGTGTMGAGMAQNLLSAGFALTVYNRTPAKTQPLVEKGARAASTPAEAATNADIILSMLSDDAASREVWLGAQGALAASSPDAILIDSSTVSPAWILELAKAAANHDRRFLDAPVTGSRRQAGAAQLTFLVGGDGAVLEQATPALKAMSKQILHAGPVGSGARLKLVNNFLAGVQVASFAEALVWLERSGLDMEKAIQFLGSAAPGSPVIQGIAPRMTAHNYDVNFYLRLMSKDLQYAQNEAATTGVDLKTAELARSLFDEAVREGYGDVDMAAVVEPLRKKH